MVCVLLFLCTDKIDIWELLKWQRHNLCKKLFKSFRNPTTDQLHSIRSICTTYIVPTSGVRTTLITRSGLSDRYLQSLEFGVWIESCGSTKWKLLGFVSLHEDCGYQLCRPFHIWLSSHGWHSVWQRCRMDVIFPRGAVSVGGWYCIFLMLCDRFSLQNHAVLLAFDYFFLYLKCFNGYQ